MLFIHGILCFRKFAIPEHPGIEIFRNTIMIESELKKRFAASMLKLVNAIKNESERCSQICGGLNEKELMIISFLAEKKSVKMSDIAENLGAPLSTLTSIMDKLVEKNIIERVHSAEDRRVVNVALTNAGKKVFNTFSKRKNGSAEQVLSGYTPEEQELLVTYISKLSESIRALK